MADGKRSRDDIIGHCMIMDSGGGFWRYEERYLPLGVTVMDDLGTVEKNYDLTKHMTQKVWQT